MFSAMTSASEPNARPSQPRQAVVRRLPVRRDDATLLRGLQDGESWARSAFFDRYSAQALGTIRKVLGSSWHVELSDVLHDAFLAAFSSVHTLRDAQAMPKWVQTISARAAYKAMRSRQARSWLRLFAPEDVPETCADAVDPELLEAHRRTHEILRRMPARQRAAFAFRYVEGMELTQVADACDVSLSTIKRCLNEAERRFVRAAQRDTALRRWLEEGERWNP